MKQEYSTMNIPVILFGNGEPPTHPSVIRYINEAKTYICLDGGVDTLIRLGHEPDYVLGDLDSIKHPEDEYDCKIISLEDQSMTDLEKSILWCYENAIKELYLIGVSGLRDDHSMATFCILLKFAGKMKITLLSNHSKINCIKNKTIFDTSPGQVVSLIPSSSDTKITTSGLQYTLQKEKLSTPTQGISNVAINTSFSIEATDWVWVIINHEK